MEFDVIQQILLDFGINVITALIVLYFGFKVVDKLKTLVSNKLEQSDIEKSLQSFIASIFNVLLKIIIIITAVSMVGIEVTTFVALIAAMGFAIGLALQGSLANFAGGVLILTLKPFRVGDYIEAAGHAGTVHEIQVFYTVLNTPDNKKITIPNANLSNSSAVNYSAYDTRRLDFTFGVGYEADIDQVKSVLYQIAASHELIFEDPQPQVMLAEHGDSALFFYLRVWCRSENYWPLKFELMEKVKKEFDAAGINIPYPQMDVHLSK